MNTFARQFYFISVLILAIPAYGQEVELNPIQILQTEVEQLKQDYENRIRDLEQRIEAAEAQALQAQQSFTAASAAPVTNGTIRSGNAAFNPAIGVIFEGLAWRFDRNQEEYHVRGFPLGGEAGLVPEGLSLGETELNFSANVDDKFTAWLTTPVVIEDGEFGIEIEEAWIETTALPAGFSARFGRFFSNTGYLNNKHAHAWDFVDQPLAYQAFLGNQYLDDGIQLRWLAPSILYMELGGEIFRGDRYPAGGSTHSGFGSYSVFTHVGGDVGDSHNWLAGISYLNSDNENRPSGDEDDPILFSGASKLITADLVWKWSPHGNWQQRNFALQLGYLYRSEDGEYTLPEEGVLAFDADQSGWYSQAVFQPFPRWRVGVRYDTLSAEDPGLLFTGTVLDPADHDPARYSFMVDWSNSEFSRLRLQLTRDKAGLTSHTQFGLQYLYSIGAHGAHSF